jgi:hypothetical protein
MANRTGVLQGSFRAKSKWSGCGLVRPGGEDGEMSGKKDELQMRCGSEQGMDRLGPRQVHALQTNGSKGGIERIELDGVYRVDNCFRGCRVRILVVCLNFWYFVLKSNISFAILLRV